MCVHGPTYVEEILLGILKNDNDSEANKIMYYFLVIYLLLCIEKWQ